MARMTNNSVARDLVNLEHLVTMMGPGAVAQRLGISNVYLWQIRNGERALSAAVRDRLHDWQPDIFKENGA